MMKVWLRGDFILNNFSPSHQEHELFIPTVAFTGVEEEKLKKFGDILLSMGGKVTENVKMCNILVASKIKRSTKFLCAIASGKPIVSPDWINASKRNGGFLGIRNYYNPDHTKFLLKDGEGEAKHKFKLANTLKCLMENPLPFEGACFFLTPSVKPGYDEMAEIIEAGGGVFNDFNYRL
jgi:PAX-interacting protein 1